MQDKIAKGQIQMYIDIPTPKDQKYSQIKKIELVHETTGTSCSIKFSNFYKEYGRKYVQTTISGRDWRNLSLMYNWIMLGKILFEKNVN